MFKSRLTLLRINRIWIKLTSMIILTGIAFVPQFAVWGDPSVSSSEETSGIDGSSRGIVRTVGFVEFLGGAEALYDAVNNGELQEALARLDDVELDFRALPMIHISSVEGIQGLAHNIVELKRAAAAAAPDENRWKQGAAALRLSADALAHPNNPIWHQYRTVIKEDAQQIRNLLQDEFSDKGAGVKAALEEFNELMQHYQVIRTAVLLSSEAWKVERSDSVIRYVSRVLTAEPLNPDLLPSIHPQLEEAMENLFPPEKAAESALVPPITAPPLGWTALMGSFIVTVLTWVGWRRYQYNPYYPSGKSSRTNGKEDAAERLLKYWKK